METYKNDWLPLFLEGQPILILKALENNLPGFNMQLSTMGEPPAQNVQEAFVILDELGPELSESEFCQLFNFDYFPNRNEQGIQDAFAMVSNVYNPGSDTLESYQWNAFDAGFRRFYTRNYFPIYSGTKAQETQTANTTLAMENPAATTPENIETAIKKALKKQAIFAGILFVSLVVLIGITVNKYK